VDIGPQSDQLQFVVVVPPRAGHLAVLDSDLAARLGPILAAFGTARFFPLQAGEFTVFAGEVFRVGDVHPLPVAGSDRRQSGDAQVQAAFPVDRRQRCRIHLDDEAGVVVAVWFPDDRDRAGLGRQLPRPADLHAPDLGQAQPPVGAQGEPVAGEPGRLPGVFAGLEPRTPDPLASPLTFHRVEEVPERPVGVAD